MRIVSVKTMQKLDQQTIHELGLPSLVLMERAALGVLTALREHWGSSLQQVEILAGNGNNGGDGLALARMLKNQGVSVRVWLEGNEQRCSPDHRTQLSMVQKLSIPVLKLEQTPDWRKQIAQASLIVDAIFGIGLSRPIGGIWAEVIETVNGLNIPVVAIDIPSGIHGDTGLPLGNLALRADLTVTCGLPKWGLMMDPALDYVGHLEIVDIGIPPSYSAAAPGGYLLDLTLAASLAPRPRPRQAHKGNFGRLVIIAGSMGMSGAAVFATEAALRAGAGLVYTCVPASIQAQVASQVPQALVVPLPDQAGYLNDMAFAPLQEQIKKADALLIGPGLGCHPQTQALVQKLLDEIHMPLVLDADGLNALTQRSQPFNSPTIITPHPGELARLLKCTPTEIQANRLQALQQGAQRYQCIHILKGARSLIGTPDGRCWVNTSGNPALARGGSGDVLAGLLAGLLAQGYPADAAALLGVYWHGLAADQAVCQHPETCLTIPEFIYHLSAALKYLQTAISQ